MLAINSTGLFSNNFTISNPQNYSIDLQQNWLNESATLTIQNTQFELFRDGLFGDFVLQNNNNIIVSAHKEALSNTFTIMYGENQFVLTGRFFQRSFDLNFNNQSVGTIEPQSMFSKGANVYLPDDMPLEVKIFIAWLALLMWRRRQRAAAAAH